jgi:hypothetical protein
MKQRASLCLGKFSSSLYIDTNCNSVAGAAFLLLLPPTTTTAFYVFGIMGY